MVQRANYQKVLINVKARLNLGSYANTQADPMEAGKAF